MGADSVAKETSQEDEPITAATLTARLDELLAHHRRSGTTVTRQEIDDLHTDGCAGLLSLEAERRLLRTGRRVSGTVSEREHELTEETWALRRQIRHLRTAVDWAQLRDAD